MAHKMRKIKMLRRSSDQENVNENNRIQLPTWQCDKNKSITTEK